MKVEQTQRTTNTVVINVSGITEGARSTYVGFSDTKINEYDSDWLTLQEAKDYGYISNFYVTSTASANGEILVTLADENYKVIQFKIVNITDDEDRIITLPTVLEFEYDGFQTKDVGSEIDITVRDMRELNLFASCICSCTTGEDSPCETLDDVYAGDPIYADYLATVSSNLQKALAYTLASECDIENLTAADVQLLLRMSNDCVSGADFKADWFNTVSRVINNFNVSVSF